MKGGIAPQPFFRMFTPAFYGRIMLAEKGRVPERLERGG